MTNEDLPIVKVAAFCENVLIEPDNVPSAIRLVDRVTHRVSGEPPGKPPEFTVQIWYLLQLRSGNAVGTRNIRLELQRVTGERADVLAQVIEFNEEEQGATFAVRLGVHATRDGLAWMHVLCDEQSLTSTPLRIAYQSEAAPA